MLKLNKTNR